jgi:hypothetical protein
MYLTRQPNFQQGAPWGGQGTQHGGIQNERASNPVIVPGPIDIGRSGPPHCVVLLEFAVEVIASRGDLFLVTKFIFARIFEGQFNLLKI